MRISWCCTDDVGEGIKGIKVAFEEPAGALQKAVRPTRRVYMCSTRLPVPLWHYLSCMLVPCRVLMRPSYACCC